MSDIEVVERHRAEMRAARESFIDPFSPEATAEFARLTELHKAEWTQRVHGRKAEEQAEKKAEERENRIVPVLSCACGAEIPRPERGKAPSKCEACRASEEAEKTARRAAPLTCHECGGSFERTPGRGRPSTRCPKCRGTLVTETKVKQVRTKQDVIVLGPNLGIRNTTVFHVHDAHCADLAKPKYWLVMRSGEHWTHQFSSQQEIVECMYDGQMQDNADDPVWATWEPYASDFTFFPCVKLPRES